MDEYADTKSYADEPERASAVGNAMSHLEEELDRLIKLTTGELPHKFRAVLSPERAETDGEKMSAIREATSPHTERIDSSAARVRSAISAIEDVLSRCEV